MATKKTKPKPEWVTLTGPQFLFAPVETALRWSGTAPTGNVRIIFHYWQVIRSELPPELQPTHGHPDTPHLTVSSQDEAAAIVDQLRAFLLARHPNLEVKKKKSLDLVRFLCSEDKEYRVIVSPESAADELLERAGDAAVLAIPLGDDRALYWRKSKHWGDVRVRATPDEILLVDSAEDDLTKLAALATGTPTDHGAWSCEQLLVGIWVRTGIGDLKKIESTKPADLVAHAGTPLRAKSSDAMGGALFMPASGTYRAETGASETASWLRFTRV